MIKPKREVKIEEWVMNRLLEKQKMKEESKPLLTRTPKKEVAAKKDQRKDKKDNDYARVV